MDIKTNQRHLSKEQIFQEKNPFYPTEEKKNTERKECITISITYGKALTKLNKFILSLYNVPIHKHIM